MLARIIRHRRAVNFIRLNSTSCTQEASPGTYVLRRVYEAKPLKSSIEGFLPKTHSDLDIIETYKIYEKIHGPDNAFRPKIELLLLDYVEDVGVPGDVVSIDMKKVDNLLFSKKAVYASPENMTKYSNLQSLSDAKNVQSSLTSGKTAKYLGQMVLAVSMSMDNPWTIERWHVRACFRKAGLRVDESNIEIPDKPISGPDITNLQDKVFLTAVTINNCERVVVRCRIHHVTSDLRRKLPYVNSHWSAPMFPVFPEDQAVLDSLPKVRSGEDKLQSTRRI